MQGQIGRFFFFLGLITLIVVIGLFQAGQYPIPMALVAFTLTGLGFWMMLRNQPPPKDADRFHTLRMMQQKGKSKGKDKDKGKK